MAMWFAPIRQAARNMQVTNNYFFSVAQKPKSGPGLSLLRILGGTQLDTNTPCRPRLQTAIGTGKII